MNILVRGRPKNKAKKFSANLEDGTLLTTKTQSSKTIAWKWIAINGNTKKINCTKAIRGV